MTESARGQDVAGEPTREEMHSALFANLIVQQSNMALMLLGKAPHPETGETFKDLEAARLFIEQLEMLEAKTKGNLTKEEAALLKQSLMSLHMAYVQAVDAEEKAGSSAAAAPVQPQAKPAPEQAAPAQSTESHPPPPAEEEHRKKFSKKY
jgi:uncharacterized protein DUF1844